MMFDNNEHDVDHFESEITLGRYISSLSGVAVMLTSDLQVTTLVIGSVA